MRNTVHYVIMAMGVITVGILLSSCKEVTVPQRISARKQQLEVKEVYIIKVIDSCEWIEVDEGFSEYYHYDIEHRPRCKFCKERIKK